MNWSFIDTTALKWIHGTTVWTELQMGRSETSSLFLAACPPAIIAAKKKKHVLFPSFLGCVNFHEARLPYCRFGVSRSSDADEATERLWGCGQKAQQCEAGSDAFALVLVQPCTEPFMSMLSAVTGGTSVMIWFQDFTYSSLRTSQSWVHLIGCLRLCRFA